MGNQNVISQRGRGFEIVATKFEQRVQFSINGNKKFQQWFNRDYIKKLLEKELIKLAKDQKLEQIQKDAYQIFKIKEIKIVSQNKSYQNQKSNSECDYQSWIQEKEKQYKKFTTDKENKKVSDNVNLTNDNISQQSRKRVSQCSSNKNVNDINKKKMDQIQVQVCQLCGKKEEQQHITCKGGLLKEIFVWPFQAVYAIFTGVLGWLWSTITSLLRRIVTQIQLAFARRRAANLFHQYNEARQKVNILQRQLRAG